MTCFIELCLLFKIYFHFLFLVAPPRLKKSETPKSGGKDFQVWVWLWRGLNVCNTLGSCDSLWAAGVSEWAVAAEFRALCVSIPEVIKNPV